VSLLYFAQDPSTQLLLESLSQQMPFFEVIVHLYGGIRGYQQADTTSRLAAAQIIAIFLTGKLHV
jgi:hypothetical protein